MIIRDTCYPDSSTQKEFMAPVSKLPVDFAVKTDRTWKETAIKILKFVLKLPLFPYFVGKYLVQRITMMLVYPLQSRVLRYFCSDTFGNKAVDTVRSTSYADLVNNGYIVRHVVLKKDGVRYSGIMVGTKQTIDNGRWATQATGNGFPIEHALPAAVNHYVLDAGYNLLMMNGPGCGRSKGTATPRTMGAAQEIAITYLEKKRKAKEIFIGGHSIGGGAVSRAIMQHDFKKDVEYTVARQMTFDKLSNCAMHMFGGESSLLARTVRGIIKWTGLELDNIEASKKLSQLKDDGISITSRVVQHTLDDSDEVIPVEATLALGNQSAKAKCVEVLVSSTHNTVNEIFPSSL